MDSRSFSLWSVVPFFLIGAAADLQFALKHVISRLPTELSLRVTYGSSGNLAAQIAQGAPIDVFLSADSDSIQKLVDQSLISSEDVFTYAQGSLALWVRADSALVLDQGMSVLCRSDIHKVSIANPQHAPYGKAAVAALQAAGIYDSVRTKLVLGDNVMQAAQFVEARGVQIGIIALSLAQSSELRAQGRYWVVPTTLYPAIRQTGALLKGSQNRIFGLKLRDFLLSPPGQKILGENGFSPASR